MSSFGYQHRGVDRYAVAGNSLGRSVAWSLALSYPERLRAAVLINATGYPETTHNWGAARRQAVGGLCEAENAQAFTYDPTT